MKFNRIYIGFCRTANGIFCVVLRYSDGDDDATESDSSNDDNTETGSIHDSDADENALPVFLWRPQTTEKMGEWEQYTKVKFLFFYCLHLQIQYIGHYL